jgi:hypothetical protein
VGTTAGPDEVERRKILPLPGPETPAPQPPSLYTVTILIVPLWLIIKGKLAECNMDSSCSDACDLFSQAPHKVIHYLKHISKFSTELTGRY